MQKLGYTCPAPRYPAAKSYPARLISAFLAIVGGLAATALLGRVIESAVSTWSPTQTAHTCFYFPEAAVLPDRESAGQMLMQAAFFGSDALLFDEGEENTGIDTSESPSPSDLSDTPHNPLIEPSERNPADTNIYTYDYASLPDGALALLPYDLSGGADAGEILLSNTTAYDIAPEIPATPYPITDAVTDEPLVLILHTHGTEAFAPEGASYVSPTDVQRSSDIRENIVAVGGVMADLLNDAGIPTLHCEIMHDLESYQRSYTLAADTIQKYLTEYPSIRYVFDVHRDAIVRTSGDLIRPLTVIDGELAAQVMLLVGTNEKGADHPDWMDNFTVAATLQSKLTATHEKFARPINIRGASFNEQFTKGSLLIEIGSAGNTLSEAKKAAEHLTYSLIEMIKENSK